MACRPMTWRASVRRACVSRTLMIATVLIASLAAVFAHSPSTARAQGRPSILVVRAPRTPASLQRDVVALLRPLGELVSDTDYARAARSQRLSPHDPEAIVAFLPGLGIHLVVTLETTTRGGGRFLRIDYRSPETGDDVVHDELPYRGGPLPSSYRTWVVSQARLALSTLASRPGGAPTNINPQTAWRTRRPGQQTQPQAPPEFGTSSTPPEFGEDGNSGGSAEPGDPGFESADEISDEDLDSHELPPRVLVVDGVVGLGLGQRAVDLPTQTGLRLLDVGPFVALDAAVRTRLDLTDAFQLSLALRYTTSVGVTSESTPAAGVPQAVPLRSQRFEAALGTAFRLGDGETIPWLGVYLGYSVQDLRGLIEISMPRFSNGGPFVRLDLRAIVAEGRVTVWATPDAQWVSAVDGSLTRIHVNAGGFALGGEVGVSVRLSSQFLLEAAYRETHAFIGTPEAQSFHDLERLLTTRLVVQR